MDCRKSFLRPPVARSAGAGYEYRTIQALYYTSHSTMDHAITPDPFSCLPTELKHLIMENLDAKDIAALQLVSRAFRQFAVSIWYQQIRKDMPWLWEVWSDDVPYFWATVTPEDIWNNRLSPSPEDSDLPIWMSASSIEGHTTNIPEHLSRWTYPKPPIKKPIGSCCIEI